ncbi:MAG: AMP-binding protein [Sphingobium sp.]
MTASSRYDQVYGAWESDPEGWWATAAQGIDWDKSWDRVFDADSGPYGRWFPGGMLNTAYNCLDRHVAAGRGEQDALIWDSAMVGEKRRYSYAQLLDLTARFAGALAQLGVTKGDRVLIYMPMVPEAAVAMLACARLGAPHSVVFGGFAPGELAKRIADAQPKVIVSASCGLEPGRQILYKPMLDEAIDLSPHKPDACVVLQRPVATAELIPGRDHDFMDLLEKAAPHAPVSVEATHPLYVLYTSGTTGKPKGIVRDTGGHAVALMRSMRMIYGLEAGDTCLTASDIGWVVGHSYIVYGPLLAGCTTIMYEGKPVGTPDAGALWRLAEEYGARTIFTAPTAIRAVRQRDPEGALAKQYDLSRLETIFLAGERCDPPTAIWLGELLGKPIVDHWWQTETGWAITASFREFGLFPPQPGSGGRPSPGFALHALDAEGAPLPRGTVGSLAIKLPMPPGAAPTLWNDDEGFSRSYLSENPGYYTTGDAGMIDEDGDVWVMGRTDDIINVAGHRLSTGAMEEVVASHGDVAECAVFGVADEIKGQIALGLVVMKAGSDRHEGEVAAEIVRMIRDRIGPVAAFRHVVAVNALPKTRSGKILRASMRRIADGGPAEAPSTIDDMSVLHHVAERLIAWRQAVNDTA